MAIKTSSAKAKGRKLQQLVRDKIIALLKYKGVEPADVKSAVMGENGEDIQLSPFARNFLPVSIECKSHKSMAIYKLYAQAQENCEDRQPVLVIKANHKEPLAVIDLDYWLDLEDKRVRYEDNE